MNNYITLYGEPLEYPHQVSVDKQGTAYYGFSIATERVSGIKDITQVIVEEGTPAFESLVAIDKNKDILQIKLKVTGRIRTRNLEGKEHSKLHISVRAQYAKLASYLIKQSDGMLRSPDALQGKRWNSSRNLRKPKVLRKEPVKDKGWYNRIARLPKKLEQSYYLDGDSVQEGIHEKTGYTFFTYTFAKINQTWKETELEWDKL